MATLQTQLMPGLYRILSIANDLKEPFTIAEFHAQLYQDMGRFVIEEWQGSSGVFVNNKRIFMHDLEEGDEIRVGSVTINFSYKNYDDHIRPLTKEPFEENVFAIWEMSEGVYLGGISAAGTITPACAILYYLINKPSEFPDEIFYEGLRHSSLVIAGYSFFVLSFRNSPLLDKNKEQWQAREGNVRYNSGGCSSFRPNWQDFLSQASVQVERLYYYVNTKTINELFKRMFSDLNYDIEQFFFRSMAFVSNDDTEDFEFDEDKLDLDNAQEKLASLLQEIEKNTNNIIYLRSVLPDQVVFADMIPCFTSTKKLL